MMLSSAAPMLARVATAAADENPLLQQNTMNNISLKPNNPVAYRIYLDRVGSCPHLAEKRATRFKVETERAMAILVLFFVLAGAAADEKELGERRVENFFPLLSSLFFFSSSSSWTQGLLSMEGFVVGHHNYL